MKVYDAASIRNVAVVGHGGSGKTQLVSALLLDAGMVSRSREGNFARYEIADPILFDLCELVCGRFRQQLQDLDSILDQGGIR